MLSALISSSLGFHAVLGLIMELFIFRCAIFFRCKEMVQCSLGDGGAGTKECIDLFLHNSGPIRIQKYFKLQGTSAVFLNFLTPEESLK